MSDPYATHIPILKGLAKMLDLRRVLEFGGGFYSTPFFLSLPDLEELVCVETDPVWRARLAYENDDVRLTVVSTLAAVGTFDLVLIDDGQEETERARTIRYVLEQEAPPVVIHDAEVDAYRKLIGDLGDGRSMVFCLEKPHTVLVWPPGWDVDRYALGEEVSRCVS